MGRPKKHHHNHSNILPFAEKEITLSFNAEQTIPGVERAAESLASLVQAVDKVAETVPVLPPINKKYWVVLEERRAALNGALVTVAKGKIVKSPDIAKRLIEQNVPLEEKSE